ncbi:hypothetical protein TanjilG_16842 [Lupinus angustifolius]|uniref:Uncharacterized protein n=1 Tax=Lupinus angustifolius TaxID=3871 RepID=A0A394D848_LUPAN|nr:hypothetical protein TanjilG_16842 [Lupinus angustifolius]
MFLRGGPIDLIVRKEPLVFEAPPECSEFLKDVLVGELIRYEDVDKVQGVSKVRLEEPIEEGSMQSKAMEIHIGMLRFKSTSIVVESDCVLDSSVKVDGEEDGILVDDNAGTKNIVFVLVAHMENEEKLGEGVVDSDVNKMEKVIVSGDHQQNHELEAQFLAEEEEVGSLQDPDCNFLPKSEAPVMDLFEEPLTEANEEG